MQLITGNVSPAGTHKHTHTTAAPAHTHIPGGARFPPRSPGGTSGAELLCSAPSAAPGNRSGPAGMSSRRRRPPRSNALQMHGARRKAQGAWRTALWRPLQGPASRGRAGARGPGGGAEPGRGGAYPTRPRLGAAGSGSLEPRSRCPKPVTSASCALSGPGL